MTSADVLDIYSALGGRGIDIWIDGGWGVDALLHRQSLPIKIWILCLNTGTWHGSSSSSYPGVIPARNLKLKGRLTSFWQIVVVEKSMFT